MSRSHPVGSLPSTEGSHQRTRLQQLGHEIHQIGDGSRAAATRHWRRGRKVKFAGDSPLEGNGFEPPVPLRWMAPRDDAVNLLGRKTGVAGKASGWFQL